MHSETALVLTVLVLCYAAVSGLIRRWYLAPALIFVVVGIVLGPSCLGWIEAGTVTITSSKPRTGSRSRWHGNDIAALGD
ncbi:MAG: sodium/hydrogen antiporter [Mycobacterium sp.]|jgi:predicted Kef-type K+ transport protein|nr:sodium/hydrogen antiporter [Mycobacterium sp.]MDT5351482.1 sodium/hydrogen antiporter [Mycobacterium sp.]